ncbi:MAG: hypothetical protein V5B38_06160 [Candidatus Accumulibacter propinquus]
MAARKSKLPMCCQQIFDAEGDGSQDDGTLFSLSGEFLEAARVLQATPPVRTGYSSATYYLLGHSAELMLKAFLHKHGQTISNLRKVNHDLEKLASLAREAGLPKKVQLDQILNLAGAYKEKSFEYRTRKRKTFPSLDLLTVEIERLQSAVFDRLWK